MVWVGEVWCSELEWSECDKDESDGFKSLWRINQEKIFTKSSQSIKIWIREINLTYEEIFWVESLISDQIIGFYMKGSL